MTNEVREVLGGACVSEAAASATEEQKTGDEPAEDTVFLDDTWSFYFHDPHDSDWTLSSYTKVCNISSANDFWGVHNMINHSVGDGMFFLMREHVFPCWDDKYNINGGCLSIKVPKEAVAKTWQDLCVDMLAEAMYAQAEGIATGDINGISVSPKYNFSIIKLWTAGQGMREEAARPTLMRGNSFFRSNMDSLRGDQHAPLLPPPPLPLPGADGGAAAGLLKSVATA